MALSGVIGSFATGTYSVSRRAPVTYVEGKAVQAAPSTFSIDACVQPATGRVLQVLAEGQRTEEVRVLYTTTALRTGDSFGESDEVTISGEVWRVFRVDRWEAFGGDAAGDHYRALLSRVVVP